MNQKKKNETSVVDTLPVNDKANLELLELMFNRVKTSDSHETFVSNIKLMRKIAKAILD